MINVTWEVLPCPNPMSARLPETVMMERFYLTYPPDLIEEPLVYLVGNKFSLITNIGGTNGSSEKGLSALQMEGQPSKIGLAVSRLQEQGIKVEPIEKTVIE